MTEAAGEGPVRIELPEPFDRRMRLGPFPSVGQALKFAGYAGVGAAAAALVGPVGWLPFVGVGLLAATYRREGRSPDEHLADYLAFRLRRRRSPSGPSRGAAIPTAGTVPSASGLRLAVLVAGGVPVAFLPPADARRLFEGFRRLLDGTEAGLYLVSGLTPMHDGLYRPSAPSVPGVGVEAAARAAYDELLGVVCRRRARRRVTIVLWSPGPADEEGPRLERAVRRLLEALEQLGVPATRLTGAALRGEADRLGIALGGG